MYIVPVETQEVSQKVTEYASNAIASVEILI